MKRAGRDFLIGLTALLGGVGVVATLVLFGEVALREPAGYEVVFRLDNAEGLTSGGSVTLNGVPIGRLTGLESATDPRDGVDVRVRLRESVRVPRDVEVSISRDLVGDARLSLTASRTDLGAAGSEVIYLAPGETVEAEASGLVDELAGMLDSRLDSVDRAAEAVAELAETYTAVGRRLDGLLAPLDADAPAGTPNVRATLVRLDATLAEAQAWLGDDSLRDEVDAVVERANRLMSTVDEAAQEWTQTGEAVRSDAARVADRVTEATDRLASVATRLDGAAGDMQRILAAANDGTGTIAQLLNNPDLYNALTDAARRVEKAVFEAQLLIEKYRKEGIPIQF